MRISDWSSDVCSSDLRIITDAGFRVIMPDLRGHGDSDKPHNPACYKPDVLADDAFDLIGHLGLTDYDLAGYSLWGRTSSSEARRVGKEGVSPCRSRWWQDHLKKNTIETEKNTN